MPPDSATSGGPVTAVDAALPLTIPLPMLGALSVLVMALGASLALHRRRSRV